MEGSLNLAALAPCEQKVDMHPMKDSCLYVPQVAGFRKCSIIGACAEIALRDQGESDPMSKMVVETNVMHHAFSRASTALLSKIFMNKSSPAMMNWPAGGDIQPREQKRGIHWPSSRPPKPRLG